MYCASMSGMNAKNLLRDVRLNYKASNAYDGYAAYGNVIVTGHPSKAARTWVYEVGTAAQLHASGKASEVMPVLEALMQTALIDLDKKKY